MPYKFVANGNYVDFIYIEPTELANEYTLNTLHFSSSDINWSYTDDPDKITFKIAGSVYDRVLISDIYFGDTAAADQDDFKEQMRVLFSGEHSVVAEDTSNHVLALEDAGRFIFTGSSSANTITVPPNSAVPFKTGTIVTVGRGAAGSVTFVPGDGVSILSRADQVEINGLYAVATIVKTDTNTWLLYGNLA